MKTISVEEFENTFSEVIEQVKSSEHIAVTSEKTEQVIGYFLPKILLQKPKRKLEILEGKATVIFHDDFEMTEEEFIGL